MNLMDSYIKRVLLRVGLIEENRVDKLRSQKFTPEQIEFIMAFSKKTVRNPEDENLVQQNQYIPWIASELKKDGDIKTDARLKVIINWINKSNFPKFPSTMPLDKVYETAVQWLLSKNLDPSTLKELPSGKSLISYPDESKWILVKDENFCVRVGEARGWCLNQAEIAKRFTKSKGGYMLVDKNGDVKMAVEFNRTDKHLIDWQGAFNKIPDKYSALKSADLISKLGEIDEMNFGHNSTLRDAIAQYPEFKKMMSSLPNIHIAPLSRYLFGLEVTPEQMALISPDEKIKNKIPLSDEEMRNVSSDVKLKHGLKLTEEEIQKLSPIAKLAFGYKIKAADIKVLPPFMQKIISVMKGKDPYDIFTYDDFGNETLYRNYEVDNKKIELYVGSDWLKYSGLNDDDYMSYSYGDSHYAIEDGKESEDYKYMDYDLLGEDNKNLLEEISNLLDIKINNKDSEGVWNFINDNLPHAEQIRESYLVGVYEYKAEEFNKVRNELVNKQQPFKLDLQTDYLTLPWTKILKFIAKTDFIDNTIITNFSDLEDAEINEIKGGYGLQDAWHNIWPKGENITYTQSEIEDYIKEDLKNFEEHPDIINNNREANYLLKKLGFIDEDGENHTVTIPGKDGDRIEIMSVDTINRKFKIRIYTKQGIGTGNIDFNNLTNYVHSPRLFEEVIRKKVRAILFEGGNFRFADRTNNSQATFTPSSEMIQTAKRALQAVQNNKLVQSDGSNEGSGLEKANSLIAATPMTHAQLKRMKAFFDNNLEAAKAEKNAGKNINNSALIQKWELWGGDAGKNWCEKHINSQQSSNKTSKKLRNPEHGVDTKAFMNPHNTRIHR